MGPNRPRAGGKSVTHGYDTLRGRIDWSRMGATAGASSQDENLSRLVQHFRESERPRYLFDLEDTRSFQDEQTIQEAELTLEHEILGHRFDGDIDWLYNATVHTSRDSEWTWSLVRHGFWIPLARAYQMTGDEKYAREFVAQLKSFSAAWPMQRCFEQKTANMDFPGDAWRSIEAGIRIYTAWLPAFVYFRHSPSWDEEAWVCFLNGLHDHAEFLCRHYSNHTRCANWLAMESTALFQLGVLFPEFKRSSVWQKLAYRRICHEVRYQFDHDGVHIERTPIYHLVAVIAFLQAYRVAVANGIPVPPYMLPILERGAEFLMRLVKPDFTLPMIGDADRVFLTTRKADTSPYEGMNLTTDPIDLNELRAFFRVMSELTGRDDFLYFSTGRAQGHPPAQRSYAMRESGYYVFRDGWGEQDSYFLLTGTQVERGSLAHHSQPDACHLELVVEGRDVLVDTGRYLYDNCSRLDWASYFQSTRAHNTVGVDGRNMGEVPDTPPTVRGLRTFCHTVETSPTMDLIELSHNGWSFLDEPVFHRRRVLYLKPSLWLVDDVLSGSGEHEFSLYFNFAPGELVADQKSPHAYVHRAGGHAVCCVPILNEGLRSQVFEGTTDPKAGWISYGYAVKQPIPQLVYSIHGTAPRRFVTAFYRADSVSLETRRGEANGEIVLAVSTASGRQTVSLGLDRPVVSDSRR